MAEIPEFERSTPIKPAAPVQGFGEVSKPFGAFGEAIAKIGAGMAQESANKYAELKGIEASENALKTGKFNLTSEIAFTEADKHFSKAYQNDLMQGLSFDGNKALKQLYQTASRSPTGEGLANYEQSGKQVIENVIANAPASIRGQLKRNLENAYMSGYMDLSDKIYDANNKYLRSKHATEADENLNAVTNHALRGDYQAAAESLQDTKADITNQEELYKETGGQRGYNPEQAKAMREMAESRYRIGIMSNKWQQAHEQGKGEQFLEDLRKHAPANLTPIQQESLVNGVLQYRQSYLSALKGQEAIRYTQALTAVDSGKMTESALVEAKRDLSETDYARLEHYIAKKQAKAGVLEAQVSSFIENKDNPVAIAGSGKKVANAAYQKLLQQYAESTGEAPNMAVAGQIARGIKHPIELFNKQLDAGIRSKDPNQSVEASQIYRTLAKANPFAVSGVSEEARSMASQINDAVRRGTPAPEAHATAYQNAQKVDQRVREERKDALKEEYKQRSDWKNYEKQQKSIANLMGFDKKAMPPGVVSDFLDAVNTAYTNSPTMSFEDALVVAKDTLQRTYGKYDGQAMYLPPTLAYGGVSEIFVKNCLIEQLHQLGKDMLGKEQLSSRYEVDDDYVIPMKEGFDINNMSRLTNKSLKEFSFKHGGIPGDVLGVSKEASEFAKRESTTGHYYRVGNQYLGDIPGKRIERDGTVTKGVFKIRSDDYTDNIPPSYSIQFLPEGKLLPEAVPSPYTTYSGARFAITEDQLRRSAYETRTRKEAKFERDKPWIERQEAIEAMREEVGELDIEQP